MEEELLTPREASRILKVHVDTIRRWIREGKLYGLKLSCRCIRIRKSEVEKLLEEEK